MLKKVTWISALVLVACLVAGAVFTPFVIRDVLQNGDQILGKFFRSTEVFSFNGKDVDTLELHFDNLPVYIEQSGDEQIYLRIEGLFSSGYAVSSKQKTEEEKSILSLAPDNDALFFDTGIPYLLRSGILENPAAWVIVRVPDWVAIETSGSDWNIRCVDDVRFKNREYYDERLWTRDENWEQEKEVEERWRQYSNQLESIKAAYTTELQQALLMLAAEEIDFEDYSERLDTAAAGCQERMTQQLSLPDGENYQNDLLQTLVKNYVELQKGAARQAGRMLQVEEYSEEYYNLRDRQYELENAAQEAFSDLTDYLLTSLEQEDAGEAFAPQDAGSQALIASSSLAPEEAPPSTAPATEAPVSPEESVSASPAQDALSAPSVYTAQ